MRISAITGLFSVAVLVGRLDAGPLLAAEPAAAPDPLTASANEARPAAPLLIDARIFADQKRTRFIADLAAKIDITVFTLADPYRVVVDMPEIRFGLPDNAGSERIVLDVTGPVAVDKTFVLPPTGDQPARLVVDVIPTSRATFLATNRAYRKSQEAIETVRHDLELAASPQATGRPVIVLDPGHGGIDNGTRGLSGILEKQVTLAFANVLRDKLAGSGAYDVYMTRTDDSFVSLRDRVTFAQNHHAKLFVSIHANSFRTSGVRGTTIYTVSEKASDKMAEDVANSENQSDVLAGLDMVSGDTDQVKDLLLDLTKRETRNFGVVFARDLVNELKTSGRLSKVAHQQASFRVLKAADVPSAMVEIGFMSNAEDEKLPQSDEWRQQTADAIAAAIADYFTTAGREPP